MVIPEDDGWILDLPVFEFGVDHKVAFLRDGHKMNLSWTVAPIRLSENCRFQLNYGHKSFSLSHTSSAVTSPQRLSLFV
jgi:hypothetical protein